jgi:hypothetical protein
MTLKVVETGIWSYDNMVEMPVDIVALDYDWWYELAKADGQLEDGEKPVDPGNDGFLYYARFQRAGEPDEPTWVDSDGHKTSAEAMKAAQIKVAGKIVWSDSSDT